MQSLKIQPATTPIDADVAIPGSKSITNRALLIAALADGVSQLDNALMSDDTRYMANAVRDLGIRIDENPSEATFRVFGTGGRIPADNAELHIGNSGTSARFLTAYLGLGHGTYLIDGVARMRERPIQDLLDGLAPLGATARCEGKDGVCPPVLMVASGLQGGRTVMRGNKSSQYFTALLQVAPYAQTDVEIRVEGDLVSKPYIDLTIAVMRDFGVEVTNRNYRSFTVHAGQRYRARTYRIEPDASNASYFFAAAALTGGRVRVPRLTAQSVQGDVAFVDILSKMGCGVRKDPDGIEVRGTGRLSGLDMDMNATPDIVPTLCALAPFASGPVNIRNVAVLRLHETDRIAALKTELNKLGVRVETRADGLMVYPASHMRPAALDAYDDHRMAMSLSLIGLKIPGITINDPTCVAKTFPTYFDVLEKAKSTPHARVGAFLFL